MELFSAFSKPALRFLMLPNTGIFVPRWTASKIASISLCSFGTENSKDCLGTKRLHSNGVDTVGVDDD